MRTEEVTPSAISGSITVVCQEGINVRDGFRLTGNAIPATESGPDVCALVRARRRELYPPSRAMATASPATTGVKFGGVAATTFSVVNATQMTVLVPAGALTGHIAITTAGGTGTSSGTFTVTP